MHRIFCLALFTALRAAAQEQHQHQHEPEQPQQQPQHQHGQQPQPAAHQHGAAGHNMSPSAMFLMNQSSGTAYQPRAWPMPMLMTRAHDWHLLWMGQAYFVSTQQSGARGGDKISSSNWGMLGAIHDFAGGSFMLRGMVSLEPATVTKRRYPLLFQSGETAFGQPIVDAQHPHDLFMELGIQYARPINDKATWNIYYAPIGDPALGPVAFPHRASALELPQASLGHHWQDSTHIANNVLTGGVTYGKFRLEASGFHGREPDEGRWNIDWGGIDSWSTRLSAFPTPNWAAQFSVGRLQDPEATHPGSIVRTTASIQYLRPMPGRNYWATSFIWGQNYKLDSKRRTNAFLAETVVPFRLKNFVTGRFEWSQRDELFANDQHLAEHLEEDTGSHAFNVSAYTAGYTRDVAATRFAQVGIGANVTTYVIASALKPYYGDRPWGVNFYMRVRLKPRE